MNINQFDHQVLIMESVRGYLDEEDQAEEQKRVDAERAAAGDEGDAFDGGNSLAWTRSSAGLNSRGGQSRGDSSRGGSSRGGSRRETEATTQRGACTASVVNPRG